MYGDTKSYIQVGIYTDYMSQESMQVNQSIAPYLPKIARHAAIYFADIPGHKRSLTFSEAFLATHLANPKNMDMAIRARSLLFQAAMTKPDGDPFDILRKNSIPFNPDRKAIGVIFKNFYVPLIALDGVSMDPVLVIHKSTQRYSYYGKKQIEDAIEALLNSFKPATDTKAKP